MKNLKFSQVSTKKVIFEAKKLFQVLPNTFTHFFAQSLWVNGQEKAKLNNIMPLEWSRYLI